MFRVQSHKHYTERRTTIPSLMLIWNNVKSLRPQAGHALIQAKKIAGTEFLPDVNLLHLEFIATAFRRFFCGCGLTFFGVFVFSIYVWMT